MSFLHRLSGRLRSVLSENTVITSRVPWKDFQDANYDRQFAEDCLYHTIGPMTENPRWSDKWTSSSVPPEEFVPNGSAPKWTRDEVFVAFAGLPDDRTFFNKDYPKSPAYGNKGGAPLYRMAKKIANARTRGQLDKSLIMDLYQNGAVQLSRLLVPGADQARGPFIKYAISFLRGPMTGGIGGDKRLMMLTKGTTNFFVTPTGQVKDRLPEVARTPNEGESPEAFEIRRQKTQERHDEAMKTWRKKSVIGLPDILKINDPAALRQAAEIVSPEYRDTPMPDMAEGNPFGTYSSEYYKAVNEYADALESRNEKAIEMSQRRIADLLGKAEDASVLVLGTQTGIADAITTSDRKTRMKIRSMSGQKNKTTGEEEELQIADPSGQVEERDLPMSISMFNHVMDLGLKTNLSAFFKGTRYEDFAQREGAKEGKLGGQFTSNEFRYLLRSFGSIARDYPGKGNMRSNKDVPREAAGWWSPFEDTEIEPIPNSNDTWTSIWSREHYPQLGPLDIARELTKEAMEFSQLGIASLRKPPADPEGLSISKQAVGNALNRAMMKFKLIALVEKDILEESSSLHSVVNGSLITERISDDLDAKILRTGCNRLIEFINLKHLNLIAESLRSGIGLVL